MDASAINAFTSIAQLPIISKRFAMKRYLGLSEEEMLTNNKLWEEEKNIDTQTEKMDGSQLRSVGITPGGLEGGMEDMAMPDGFDIDSDMEMDSRDLDAGEMADVDSAEPPEIPDEA
jgi:hypothetical protein